MSNNIFQKALSLVLQLEGGLQLHQNPTETSLTYAGIYQKAHPTWEGWAYIGKGQTPPFKLVETFYYNTFWKPFESIQNEKIKILLFETAVNLGLKQAVKLAQQVLATPSNGILDPQTVLGINSTDPEKFLLSFALARIAFYVSLVSKNPTKYRIYLLGWLNRVFKVLNEVLQ